jgi:hypothetical protein
VRARGQVYLCFGRIGGDTPPATWESDGGPLPFAPGGRVMAIEPLAPADERVSTWIATADGAVADRCTLDPRRADEAPRRPPLAVEPPLWQLALLGLGCVLAVGLRFRAVAK